MDAFSNGKIAPGPGVITDGRLDDFVRDTPERTCHPCGTCRIGKDDTALGLRPGETR